MLIVADAGYDAPRLACLLRDLPVQVLARMRSDRVLRRAAPPRQPHILGRPPRHGGEFVFGQPDTWGTQTPRRLPTPASTAPQPHAPGTDSAPGSPTARPGRRPGAGP
ncbi:transposase [Streptomyces sp. NRRL B-2790]|uniref:transposase n=1 Tax=Streptomyces sp. NRRL B-2790 TaxID=1463835 RepID=UPI003561DD4C